MRISYLADLLAGISLKPHEGTVQAGTACVAGDKSKGSEGKGLT